jgi:AsmA protein
LASFTAADVSLALRGEDLAQAYPVLRVALPKTPPYEISGRLHHAGASWQYEHFAGRVGNSDLAGSIAVNFDGPRPSVQADLNSNSGDLTDLGPLIGVDAAKAEATDANANRVLPDEPFRTERWTTADMDVRLKAKRMLHVASLPLDDLDAHLILRDGVLKLDPLNFGVAGGNFVSTITLDGSKKPLQATINTRVQRLQADRLLSTVAPANGSVGRVNGEIELKGSGDSVKHMLATAEGRVALVVADGEVSRLMLKMMGLDLGGVMWVKLTGDSGVQVRCGAASFAAHRGVLKSEALVLDTTDTRIVGEGEINLADETLALTIRPQPKSRSILSLRSPLHIGGTLKQPQIVVDKTALVARGGATVLLGLANPFAALIPLVETGPGKDSDCGQLIASAEPSAKRPADNSARK